MSSEKCQELFPDLLEKSWSLAHLGIAEYAWEKTEIMKILGICRERKIPVLGGDVYKIRNGKAEVTYDNWFINDDGTSDHAERSIDAAVSYIKEYESIHGEDFVYTIVLK